MTWQEIRQQLPDRWIVVEALAAHSANDRRILDDMAIAGVFEDSTDAWLAQGRLNKEHPGREFYPFHTSRESIEIRERTEPLSRGVRIRQ
jgi:hypothetical protein